MVKVAAGASVIIVYDLWAGLNGKENGGGVADE
jgi:hypothetical protein